MGIERTFCLKCNREVPPEDIRKNYMFIENAGNIVRVDNILIHRECGGVLRSLVLHQE